MTKTSAASILCTISLAACASVSPQPVQCPKIPSPPPIAVEQPGYFQKAWMDSLQTFNRGLENLSSGATSSTSTPSVKTP